MIVVLNYRFAVERLFFHFWFFSCWFVCVFLDFIHIFKTKNVLGQYYASVFQFGFFSLDFSFLCFTVNHSFAENEWRGNLEICSPIVNFITFCLCHLLFINKQNAEVHSCRSNWEKLEIFLFYDNIKTTVYWAMK